MTLEQKKLVLQFLKQSIKEEYPAGNIGGETDIANADCLVAEDEFTATAKPEGNIIAKTFDTQADFDSYINQRRGIEMTPKEQQAILDYDKTKPVKRDKFFVRFETTDEFGTNSTTVIKKLKEGTQFCWTAFSKYESAEDEGKPEGGEEDKENKKEEMPDLKEQAPTQSSSSSSSSSSIPSQPSNLPINNKNEENDDITVNDTIRITKTIPFVNENDGTTILGEFLNKLDI